MGDSVEVKKKLVMVGDPGVGKTSLIKRYVSNVFGDEYLTTIGTNITKKVVRVPNPNRRKGLLGLGMKGPEFLDMNLNIWDIAGQKTFIRISESYYRGAKGALLVCDMTRRETLDKLPNLIADVRKANGAVPVVVVGNKSDLADRLQFELRDLAKVALPANATYYITSAKTGDNVERAFRDLAAAMAKDDGEA